MNNQQTYFNFSEPKTPALNRNPLTSFWYKSESIMRLLLLIAFCAPLYAQCKQQVMSFIIKVQEGTYNVFDCGCNKLIAKYYKTVVKPESVRYNKQSQLEITVTVTESGAKNLVA